MTLHELPKEIQEKVIKLAARYPFNIQTVIPFYLMGGDEFAERLCDLKLVNMPDWLIELENNKLWKEKNDGLWEVIGGAK